MRFRWLAAFLASILLSGCFVSRAPFITPDTADHPLPSSATFSEEGGSGAQTSRKLSLENGAYVFTDEDMNGTFLLRGIGNGFYIAQEYNDESRIYAYDLVKIGAGTFEQYHLDCDKISGRDYASTGAVTGFSGGGDDCYVRSWSDLVDIFRGKLKAGATPDTRYRFQ